MSEKKNVEKPIRQVPKPDKRPIPHREKGGPAEPSRGKPISGRPTKPAKPKK